MSLLEENTIIFDKLFCEQLTSLSNLYEEYILINRTLVTPPWKVVAVSFELLL